MMSNKNQFINSEALSVDEFFDRVLFDKKIGYYSSKIPFGSNGDFLTSPSISNVFSEIIGIWLISSWHTMGKPKKFNIVELGPGDGSLSKILIKSFKKFPEFNNIVKIFLYEKSKLLQKIQKKNIKNSRIKWVDNFAKIKEGPVIFFGNEFFDAIPIKQFLHKNKSIYEKYYIKNKNNKVREIYKKASLKNIAEINKFNTIKNLKFIEFPKLGLEELKKIIKKISTNTGGLLLIDYGYLEPPNKSTLQSVMNHKKNKLLHNLGKADVTSLVNFKLLKEHFAKNNLKVKKIVTQKYFLQKMGILNRANNLSKKMSFKEKSNLYFRLQRLLDMRLMGDLFKVIFTFKFKKNNFLGFE